MAVGSRVQRKKIRLAQVVKIFHAFSFIVILQNME
jgi:hypothetical protein